MGVHVEMAPSAATTRATVDRVLRELGRARAKSDYELGLWLLHGFRLEVHRVHGFASFREYAEWVFGFSGRATEERLRTAEALQRLPKLSAAFEAGEVLYSVVREVSRVATAETEAEWLAAVEGKKAAQVERMVSGRGPGDRPGDAIPPEAERHRLAWNVSGATRALVHQAREVATRASGGRHLSDDDFLEQVMRTFLRVAEAHDEERAAAASASPAAADGDAPGARDEDARDPRNEDARDARGEGARDARNEDARGARGEDARGARNEDARGARGEGARDARGEGARDARAEDARGARGEDARGARGEGARDARDESPADGRAPYQIALTVCERCRGATQDAGGVPVVVDEVTTEVAACDAQHVGRVDGTAYRRAAQSVPPRVRRAVVRRHGRRCAVPGCRNRECDVHHIDLRSEGGSHDPERLVYLCTAHHRACHEHRLVVRGTWSSGFTFEHADGTPYGSPKVDGARAKTLSDVFELLCSLGFRQKEARHLVDRVRPHVGAETGTEAALKMALAEAHVPGVREAPAPYAPIHADRPAPTWGLGRRFRWSPRETPRVTPWRDSRATPGDAESRARPILPE
jgi:hypothetical protein